MSFIKGRRTVSLSHWRRASSIKLSWNLIFGIITNFLIFKRLKILNLETLKHTKMSEMRWQRISNGMKETSLRPLKPICYRPLEEIEKETRRLLNRLEKKRQAALIEITKHFQLNYSSQQSLGNPEDFDNEFSPVKKRKTFWKFCLRNLFCDIESLSGLLSL